MNKKRVTRVHSRFSPLEWQKWFSCILDTKYFKPGRSQARAVAFLVEPRHKGMVLVFRHDNGFINFDDLLGTPGVTGEPRRDAKLVLNEAVRPRGSAELEDTIELGDYIVKYIDPPTMDNWPEIHRDSASLVIPTRGYVEDRLKLSAGEVDEWCRVNRPYQYLMESSTKSVKRVQCRAKGRRRRVLV